MTKKGVKPKTRLLEYIQPDKIRSIFTLADSSNETVTEVILESASGLKLALKLHIKFHSYQFFSPNDLRQKNSEFQ